MSEDAPRRPNSGNLEEPPFLMMSNLLPFLSTILPIIAGSLLAAVLLINLYIKIRRKFPVSVNCWFCNTWSKVSYDERSNFDCPVCLQYNGFTKDGDYNKVIPEQHDELMNKSRQVNLNANPASNGLCKLCNNNQQLKIFQLAHFTPLVEENYDVEIEHFQKQLEKAYKLCKKCDKVLKKTIEKQNGRIFGNHVKNFCNNGVITSYKKISKNIKSNSSILYGIDQCLSMTFVLLTTFIIVFNVKFFTKNLSNYVPMAYLPVYKSAIALVNTSELFKLTIPYLIWDFKVQCYLISCCLGLWYQLMQLTWGSNPTAVKVNRLLCWVILILINWVASNKSYATYILLMQGLCCLYLLCTVFIKDEVGNTGPVIKGKTMRKLVKNLEYTCTDFSETGSDFENISSSTQSHNSSDYLNKSTYSNNVPPQNYNTANSVFNSSFAYGKKSNYEPSLPYDKRSHDSDLNISLNKLNLGDMQFKPPSHTASFINLNVKRPKPVLSPPKLQNINSWVAGGFWRNAEGAAVPPQPTNLSRASSESSGFGSQNNDQLAPPKNHFLGEREHDRFSVTSGFNNLRTSPCPSYLFAPIEFRNNAFYPNLQQNNMLLVQGGGARSPCLIKCNDLYRTKRCENWSDKINLQATQSFRDLSLQANN